MPNKPVQAVGEAMPADAHFLGPARLAGMSMRELITLYDAFKILEDVVGGLINQPKFEHARDNAFNSAGELFDNFQTHLLSCMGHIAAAAEAARPTDICEREDRAWLLLSAETLYREDIKKFAKRTAQLVAAAAEGA